MSKNCVSCHASFDVTTADREFLDKVSPTIEGQKLLLPDPTHCVDCRQRRREAFRNENHLYRRTCDKCKKSIISIYSPSKQLTVYCPECWWKDDWDATDFAQDMDFDRPFFEQFHELRKAVPRISLHVISNENSEFINLSGYNKNCYLLFAAEYDEDCLYGTQVIKSTSCIDALQCFESQFCYEVVDVTKCYQLFFSKNCNGCKDSMFLSDCRNCTDCLFCTNLRGKQYYVFNEQCSPEDYRSKKAEIIDALQNGQLNSLREKFQEMDGKSIHRAAEILNCENVVGNYLTDSRNLQYCFDVSQSEDCTYLFTAFHVKDILDVCHATDVNLAYEGMSIGYNSYNILFTGGAWTCSDTLYTDIAHSCSNIFGCIGLRNKKYCILNKQYSEEDYAQTARKIVEHMQKTGEYGEYFPIHHSPFAYNETLAQEYYPLTKQEALTQNFSWEDESEITQTGNALRGSQIPLSIDAVNDSIVQSVIECEVSGKPFRFVKQELDFYRQMHLPLPRIHPDERHRQRLFQRSPRKLFTRACMKCGTEIRTPFAPDKPEIVYCEKCYLENVY